MLADQVQITNLENLFSAIQSGRLVDVKFCLSLLNKNLINERFNGATPVWHAVLTGNAEMVRILLEFGGSSNIPSIDRVTPLHLAAAYGYTNIARLLIQRPETCINACDVEGLTPIWRAIQNGHLSTVKLLLGAGANPYIGSNFLTILLEIAKKGDPTLVRLPEIALKDHPPLHVAVQKDEYTLLNALLEAGSDFNKRDKFSNTALMIASAKGDCISIHLLLSKGADIESKKHHGINALMLGVIKRQFMAVELLLINGADVRTKSTDGSDALILAAHNGDRPLIELLLGFRADTRSSRSDGTTALMLAVQQNQIESVITLLANGADVEAQTIDGRTALIFAVQNYLPDVARLLITEHRRRSTITTMFCLETRYDNPILNTQTGIALMREASKIGGYILQDTTLKFALQNKDMPHDELVTTVKAILSDLSDAKAKDPQMDMHVAAALITGHEVTREEYTIRTTEGNLERLALYIDKDTGDVISTQKLETHLLHLDPLTTSFNTFMKLAHDCSSNLQAFGTGLLEQANTMLNKLLDAALEATEDGIMITSLLDLVEMFNRDSGYVPLPPRKLDDEEGDSQYVADNKLLELPGGSSFIGITENNSSAENVYFVYR